MTVIEIVAEFLRTHGYDGLCNPDAECGCGLDDFVPCGAVIVDCLPAYRHLCDACPEPTAKSERAVDAGCEWYEKGGGCYQTGKQGETAMEEPKP